MSMTREERIQQIRDCGQTIFEKAESIYGDYACPTNLQVVITMKANELPNITAAAQAQEQLEQLSLTPADGQGEEP